MISIFSVLKNIEILNTYKSSRDRGVLQETFKDSNIKVIICSNKIDYVQITNRDRIFYMYHSSTIGGHSGVNRTYNRIKEKYFSSSPCRKYTLAQVNACALIHCTCARRARRSLQLASA